MVEPERREELLPNSTTYHVVLSLWWQHTETSYPTGMFVLSPRAGPTDLCDNGFGRTLQSPFACSSKNVFKFRIKYYYYNIIYIEEKEEILRVFFTDFLLLSAQLSPSTSLL